MSKPKKAKTPVRRHVSVRAFDVMCRAVEEGVQYGGTRAYKHGKPDQQALLAAIEQAVVNELCDVFEFTPELRS